MQIEADQSVCPACGGAGHEHVVVLHHLICAYVGPEYDFALADGGHACPKCRRAIAPDDPACEIVGASARCNRCGREMVVSPPAAERAAPTQAPASAAAGGEIRARRWTTQQDSNLRPPAPQTGALIR